MSIIKFADDKLSNRCFTSSQPWYFHAYSIWLFTFSDLKTIVIPKTVFGVLNATAISLSLSSSHELPSPIDIIIRLPLVAFWAWMNLLPFTIDNQRQPASILEDSNNKPWRTLPSKRMTPTQAKCIMLVFYPLACLASVWLGGLRQCLCLIILGFCYNDLNFADCSWVSRNLINGLGFCCFASGAYEVALRMPLSLEHRWIIEWLGIIAGIVFSTVQTQDMYDQRGDSQRGRKTMPLEIGDGPARWITAVAMGVWTTFCPVYWGLLDWRGLCVGALGLAVAFRTLLMRDIVADKRTFRIWNLWMACLYALPLVAMSRRH
jgi:4-hydroxybenzoate polyprenyltransferase